MSADAPRTADSAAESAATGAPTDDDLIREYATLIRRNRALDKEKRDNTKRMDAIQQRVLDIFAERQTRSMGLIGLGNLHLKRKASVKVLRSDGDYSRDATQAERDRAAEILRACGLGELIKPNFNLQSVRGQVTEWEDQGEQFPDGFDEGFTVDHFWEIQLTTG